MKLFSICFLSVFSLFSQENTKVSVNYSTISLIDIESLSPEIKADPFKFDYIVQMKRNLESIDYKLSIVNNESLFQTTKKMDIEGAPVNVFQKMQNNQKFYVNPKKYVEQLESFGETLLIMEEANQIKWNLHRENKDILGYKCYRANYIKNDGTNKMDVEAWYAPEIPHPFGPKGYHGLPGLILEVKQNKKLIFIASEINWNAKVFAHEPTIGRKISREDFNLMLSNAVEEMKSYSKN